MSVKHHSKRKVFLLFSRRVALFSSFCFDQHVHEVVTEAVRDVIFLLLLLSLMWGVGRKSLKGERERVR